MMHIRDTPKQTSSQQADLRTTDPLSLTDILDMPIATTTQKLTDPILPTLANEVLIHLNSQDILVFRSVATSFKLIPLPNHLKDRLATKNDDDLKYAFRCHLGHLDHIYSPSNQRKIVLELLKNMQDSSMFKDIAENFLVSYLNGCESLYLHGCPIDNEQLKILSPLLPPSVQDLDLSYTNITDVSLLAKLTSLQKLELGCITNIDFELFATLTSLKILHLEKTNIPKDGLSKLPLSLEKLSFEITDITDFSALAKLKKLKELRVSESTIDDFRGLAKLTSLKTLELIGTNLKDDDLGKFPQGLWEITIGGNEITDISKLANHTSLEILYLDYSDITENGLAKLPPKLKELYIEGTNITDQWIDQLKQSNLCLKVKR